MRNSADIHSYSPRLPKLGVKLRSHPDIVAPRNAIKSMESVALSGKATSRPPPMGGRPQALLSYTTRPPTAYRKPLPSDKRLADVYRLPIV